MRLFFAIVLAGLGIAGAVALYSGTAKRECTRYGAREGLFAPCAAYEDKTPAWATAAAIAIGFVGVAAGVAVGASGRK